MRFRLLPLSSALWLFAVPIVSAQLSSHPNQNRVAVTARLSSLTESDLKTLTVQAASGDPEAEFWLSLTYAQGRLVPQDFKLAKSWMLKASEQGYSPAQEKVGAFYGKGEPESERWLLRAAEQGDADALGPTQQDPSDSRGPCDVGLGRNDNRQGEPTRLLLRAGRPLGRWASQIAEPEIGFCRRVFSSNATGFLLYAAIKF